LAVLDVGAVAAVVASSVVVPPVVLVVVDDAAAVEDSSAAVDNAVEAAVVVESVYWSSIDSAQGLAPAAVVMVAIFVVEKTLIPLVGILNLSCPQQVS
jgi:hypothetical protein